MTGLRRNDTGELVELEFRTGRPQDSALPIKRTERLCICFSDGDAMSFVYVLRGDFPDTAHQNLPAEGDPRAICTDKRSWPSPPDRG